MAPIREIARGQYEGLKVWRGKSETPALAHMSAALEMISRAGLSHSRPPYGIDAVTVGNREVAITEEPALVSPFGTLLHFKKDIEAAQPRVMIVAPLSGHFATLLRSTVRTMLPDHDVYITDWHNARDVSLADGRFGFEEYVDHLIQFLEHLGPGAHVVAVCQPCVQALVAVSLMEEGKNPAKPSSMTLMAGPVDTRISPTEVNKLATTRPIEWFENNLLATVPARYVGAGRRVYPGFVQLNAFMSMNKERHIKAHRELYQLLAAGETDKAEVVKTFYDEYFAVLDLPAEFYIETVNWVFQRALLPRGELTYRGHKVDPRAVTRTALLTVEGERDDICAVGQTLAAHDLCSRLRPYLKRHHLQAGVGHYGVFSGRRWENQIYPLVRNVILASD
ncbi:poly(3-hydroxybutyrate) depolymerase [Chelatococcus reniformis]|uniref:Poly(3-hydroxybutyrate) depolymerase n=2 Tax=Chelatococcus reniformis TaxID=1494448 RepID=A0A916UAN4_9HYPH|nr:poly(3-hydroxybutyrate) depolymerase [Chelatococcus reniformis]